MPLGKSPILQQDTMAESDTSKYVLFNDAIVKLEDAQNRALPVDFSTADVTLLESQLLSYGVFKAQGHTVVRTLTVPATVGSGASLADTNRVFVVRNEGTGTVTVEHTGVGESVDIPPAKGAILHADGTDIYALGAGVDGGAADFLTLTDTPGAFTGEAGKVLAVNGAETALEFVDAATGGAVVFTALTDTPAAYTGEAGKFLAVTGAEDGVEFVNAPSGGSSAFTGLSDTPGAYTGEGGKVLAVNVAETAVEFVDAVSGGAVAFTGLTDTPANYTAGADKFVKVNSAGNGLEFVDGADINAGVFRGASTSLTTATVIAATTDTIISWDGVKFDSGSFFSAGSPTRLTIPSGTTHITLTAGAIAQAAETGSDDYIISVLKNGVMLLRNVTDNSFWGPPNIHSGPIAVSPGDYFELQVWCSTSWSLDETNVFLAIHDITNSSTVGLTQSTPTANHVVVDADLSGNKVVVMNVASANTVTVNTGLTGSEPLTVIQGGAGQTTFVAGAGVTINSADGNLALRVRYSSASLIPDADNANTFFLIGDLAA